VKCKSKMSDIAYMWNKYKFHLLINNVMIIMSNTKGIIYGFYESPLFLVDNKSKD